MGDCMHAYLVGDLERRLVGLLGRLSTWLSLSSFAMRFRLRWSGRVMQRVRGKQGDWSMQAAIGGKVRWDGGER